MLTSSSVCQEVTEMLSSHGVKREGQPEGEQPVTKVFVHERFQFGVQDENLLDSQAQLFTKSSKLSLKSSVEPQNQERSSQLQSQLEATSGIHPQVLPQLHDKSPNDQRKATCQAQQVELKQPLLSSVVRKVQMKPQTEVHLISVGSSQTSSFGPSDLQVVSVKSSQTSGFGPSGPLQAISTDSSQTSGFGPTDLQVISTDLEQKSGTESSDLLQSTSSTMFTPSTLSKSSTVTQLRMPIKQQFCSPPKWQLQTSLTSPHQREKILARSYSFPQPHEPSQTQSPSTPLSCPSTCLDTPITVTHLNTPIKQHLQQPQTLVTTIGQRQRVLAKSHSFPKPSEALGVPHVPVQNEVYARAQALARSRLDKAKQHLHDHIQDVITVISARDKSKRQSKKKQVRPFQNVVNCKKK